jgi:hypothetical protein
VTIREFLVKFFADDEPHGQRLIVQAIVNAESETQALAMARDSLKQSHPEVAICKYWHVESRKGGGG